MRRRSFALVLAAVALVIAIALPSQGAVLVKATAARTFQPKAVSIAKGTRVTWRSTGLTHSVTAYGGGWTKNSTIASGASTGFTFQKTGTFRYRCRFHSTLAGTTCTGMCGRVTVS